MAGLLLLGGCAAEAPIEESPRWSTKKESIVGRPVEDQALTVAADIATSRKGAELRAAATDLLHQAMECQSALVRANAIEAFHGAPHVADPAIQRGLADENRGVRFAAALSVGRLRKAHLAHLLEPLLDDPSGSVRAAALYGLKVNGVPADLTPMASLLASDDPEVRANTAMVLGELGDPSALDLLRGAMGRGLERASPERSRVVDMQIAEAMAMLGDDSQLDGIRAALFAPGEQGELTALACQICGRIGDQRVSRTLLDLASRSGRRQPPAEVRMAATAALARIDPASAPIEVPMSYAGSPEQWLRAQAAMTLGEMGEQSSLAALSALLRDGSPLVQVSAAAAILRVVPSGDEGETTAGIDTNPGHGYKADSPLSSRAGGRPLMRGALPDGTPSPVPAAR